MNINVKLFAISSYNFVQPSMMKLVIEQQKKIALVVTVALGFLAAWYLITRCCLKGNRWSDASSQRGNQPKINLPTEGQVKVDHTVQKVDSPKTEKLTANDGEKGASQPAAEEPEASDHPKLPVEQPLDEKRVDEESEGQQSVKSPVRTDDPKKTVAEIAADVDFHAGFKVKAVDEVLLNKADTLSQAEKDQLSAFKESQLKLIDLMQGAIQLEQEKISRLKDRVKRDCQSLDAEQAKLVDYLKKLEEHEQTIAMKEKAIQELIEELHRLSQGVRETVMRKVSYGPEDEIEKNGDKFKASEFVGKLKHEIKIDKTFTLVPEDTASTYDLNVNKHLAVMKGVQYTLSYQQLQGSFHVYSFETEWKGNGVLPWIEITWLSSNADFNEASIINGDSDLRRMKQEAADLRERLPFMQQSKKWLEDGISRLKDSIARAKAELKDSGEETSGMI